MLKITVLYSGSSGNAVLVAADDNYFLIDCGVSAKKIEKKLNCLKICPSRIKNIIITHEHSDHITGVGPLCRKYENINLIITKQVYEKINGKIGKIKNVNINDDISFSLSGVFFHKIQTFHDALEPFGLFIKYNGSALTVLTDTGKINKTMDYFIRQSDLLLIETNYDDDMIMDSTRPYSVIERVKGGLGHLSNAAAGRYLKENNFTKLKQVICGHISRDHNTADKIHGHFKKLKLNYHIHDDNILKWFELK